jgi:hypothetical protein
MTAVTSRGAECGRMCEIIGRRAVAEACGTRLALDSQAGPATSHRRPAKPHRNAQFEQRSLPHLVQPRGWGNIRREGQSGRVNPVRVLPTSTPARTTRRRAPATRSTGLRSTAKEDSAAAHSSRECRHRWAMMEDEIVRPGGASRVTRLPAAKPCRASQASRGAASAGRLCRE